MLLEGIKIVSSELLPSIWLSKGTSFEYETIQEDYIYYPQLPWREPSKEEKDCLLEGKLKDFRASQLIGLCKLPEDLIHNIQHALFNNPQFEKDDVEPHIQPIENYVREHFSRPEYLPFQSHCYFSSHATCLKTVTRVPTFFLPHMPYIGLHVDYHDGLSFYESDQARNRICINIGQEDRYFLFINLPIQTILSLLQCEAVQHPYPTSLGRAFMAKFPGYPVVKLCIPPGYAYIAPTEILIHDATTLDKRCQDLTLTFLGYFYIPI